MNAWTWLGLVLTGAMIGAAAEEKGERKAVAKPAPTSAPKVDVKKALGAALGAPAGSQGKPEAPKRPRVVTIYDEEIAARPVAIEAGELVLNVTPPRRVALDEVQRVELENLPTLQATWVGQDNHDFVQIGGVRRGNGIQDMHVVLSGLPAVRSVKQVVVECKQPPPTAVWRLETAGTPSWRLALERAEGSEVIDLYMEPPLRADCFEKDFSVAVTLTEGGTLTASVKASTHTHSQLKVSQAAGPAAPAADSAPGLAVVDLQGGDVLRGELLGLKPDTLQLRTSWAAELEIPLLRVLGIRFGTAVPADVREKYQRQLSSPGSEDVAWVRGEDEGIVTVAGRAQELVDGKLRFTYEGEARSINPARLVALAFAAHPPAARGAAPYQVFQLLAGDRLSGVWTGIGGDAFEMQTAWGARMKLPGTSVSEIAFRNGKLAYLSDLEPAAVDEVPYFGRLMTYRRDVNLQGEPLKMKDKLYKKGLAVHSRAALTYELDGRYETFKTTVGFDDAAGGRGRVVCRVLGDGKALFAEKALRGDKDPVAVSVAVAGVKQLRLEVDFGEAEDTGDRVIWAEARVFRGGKQ